MFWHRGRATLTTSAFAGGAKSANTQSQQIQAQAGAIRAQV
jgi:hypothetical protein